MTGAAVAAAALAAVAAMSAPSVLGRSGHSAPSTAVAATAHVVSSTADGYQGRIVLRAAAHSVASGWTVRLSLPAGETLSTIWNGVASGRTGDITITPTPWSHVVGTGYDVPVGFRVSGRSGQIERITCTVDGHACGG